MAKSKKSKLKIPKEIAGVKIPKELRKKAKVAIAFAESPMARELLAAGLTAAAAALAKAGDSDRKLAPAAPAADDAAPVKPAKRQRIAAVAKEIAMGVATAYADEAAKKEKNGRPAAKPEPAAH